MKIKNTRASNFPLLQVNSENQSYILSFKKDKYDFSTKEHLSLLKVKDSKQRFFHQPFKNQKHDDVYLYLFFQKNKVFFILYCFFLYLLNICLKGAL